MDSFYRFLGEKPGGLHKISVCGRSPQREIGWRSLCFVLWLFICLFIIFFIYCLFVCLLFIYFYRAVCWVMHQLCGLVLLEGGKGVAISMELFGGFGGLALALLILFSSVLDAGCDEKLAFIFNLLLLLCIPVYTKVYFLCINQCIDLVCKLVY